MRNFIAKIIERLRGFISSGIREAPGETDLDDTIPMLDEHTSGPARIDVATLSQLGIRFKGISYDSPALREMLAHSGSGKAAEKGSRSMLGEFVKVTVKWDPSDASSIKVWNGVARPQPHWITVAASGAEMGLSFADHARLRDLARTHQMAFSTEAEQLEALERLKQHWAKLAEQDPMREIRRQRRLIGLLDSPIEEVLSVTADDAKADPLHGDADVMRPRDRKPSKPALAKAKRAKTHKAAAARAKAPTRVSKNKRK